MSLERRAGAERHQRQEVRGGDAHDPRSLVDAPRPHDHVGAGLRVERLVVPVLREHVVAGADAIGAEQVP